MLSTQRYGTAWHSRPVERAERERVDGRCPSTLTLGPSMSSLSIYLIGFILLVGGLAMGMHLAGLPDAWVAVGAIVLIGVGIISGVGRTRTRDSSPVE